MRIFILGFMGAGKSYLGKELANMLGFRFVDLDELIEAQLGLSVAEIFETGGELAFREAEAACLRSLGHERQVVVATGGGTPCFFENMQWMNDNGVTVFFRATPGLLAQRLIPEKVRRPLLAGLCDEEVEAFITKKLAERTLFYGLSHLEFEVPQEGNQGIEVLAKYLSRFLG